MHWWQFWTADSWKSWWALRPAWSAYRSEAQRIKRGIQSSEADLARLNSELSAVTQHISWAREIFPREVPIRTARGESGLGEVSGVALMEIRKREGKNVWVPVDQGTVYLTDRKAVFAGRTQVQFTFDKITSESLNQNGLLLSVSTRKKAHVLSGPAEKIATLISASRAVARGESATALYDNQAASIQESLDEATMVLDNGRQQIAELEIPPRPISPAWVPASILLLFAMTGGALADIGSGGSQQASLNPFETTTTLAADDPTATTAVPASTTTTNVVGGSEVLPDVPQANVLFAPPTANASGDPRSPFDSGVELVTVESITDGDTIDIQLGDGNVDTVRLIGINSSESGECFSDEASLILSLLAPVGSQIGMTIDKTDRDIYGRLLRNVWVGTMSVNEEMVRRGAAIAREYPPDTALAGRLNDAQDEARDGQLGLWAPSACGPSAGTEISIVRIEADAAGDDNENLNEEYVRLRNSGDLAVDMTGWVLKDASASHRYAFPAGFLLASGLEVRIYTGCGTDTQTSLYWCSGGAIWNNDGDTAFVLDQNGNTVVYQDYVPVITSTSSTTSTTTTTPATTAPPTTTSNDCHPSYTGQCVPVGVEDVDCLGGSGNGPYYVGRVTIVGPDEYGLDGNDKDGIGCENS